MSDTAQRELYINARSLILKALDLMDKAYQVGKYKQSHPVPLSPSDSVAGIIEAPARVSQTVDQNKV